LGNAPIAVPPTTKNPSYPHQPWHWLDQSQNCSHLDPLPQFLALPKSSPPQPQSTNQNLAGRHGAHFRIRSLSDLRNQCSQFVCNCWFFTSLEDPFSRVPDPTQLENWLALNEARIPRYVASRRNNLHTRQQHVNEHFTSITSPSMSVFTHSVQFSSQWKILLVVIDFNAPLTCEPGGSADNETSARC
jgi:hypothetical protein